MKKSRLLGALCVAIFSIASTSANAAAVSFTGEDLYYNPNATLHSTITTLSGTSLVFSPIDVTSNQFEKLVSLPLSSLGAWSGTDGVVVTVSLNMTRLSCLPVFGDSCGPDDHDAPIALGNGSLIVGSEIADNNNGSAFLDEFTDMGTYGERTRHDFMFDDTGFPNIGESYNADVTFTLNTGGTLVSTTLLSGSGSATGNTLGGPSGLEFLLMRDNGQGEQYQLNSLSISSDALTIVPIPPSVWLFGSGLLGLIGIARRKKAA